MPERAHVTSVEVLDSFRRALILYTDRARGVLDEVGADIVRMKVWLETEQRSYWERQVRRRQKELEQARQVLLNARLSDPHGASAPDFAAVRQATRASWQREPSKSLAPRDSAIPRGAACWPSVRFSRVIYSMPPGQTRKRVRVPSRTRTSTSPRGSSFSAR